jgi:cytoskeletal protein CcmA (bactofilin family)
MAWNDQGGFGHRRRHGRGRYVEIADTARISGTVSGDAIAVAEGAVVEGVMQTTGRNQPTEFVEKRQTGAEK